LRLAHFFGTSAEFWLNLQGLYDLRIAQQEAGKNYQGPSHPQAHDRRPRIDQLPTCRMMLELARSRVAQDQLSRVESGKVAPTLEILLGVATKFGKSLDWIVRGESIS
jgi:hypothetical protein